MADSIAKNSKQSKAQSATTRAAQANFLPTLRELVRTYQAILSYADQDIREKGLTQPQFDVIATLGGTNGMTMGEVAERTLVTKGTMTGIVDRLEAKGLVRRDVPPDNRRCCIIALTPAGEAMFEQVFPAHIAYLKKRFDHLDPAELEQLYALLSKLRKAF